MELQLNRNWKITTNPHNFILEQKEKNKKGDYVYKQKGFYTHLDSALNSFLEHRMMQASAKDLIEVKALIKEVKAEIATIRKGLKTS